MKVSNPNKVYNKPRYLFTHHVTNLPLFSLSPPIQLLSKCTIFGVHECEMRHSRKHVNAYVTREAPPGLMGATEQKIGLFHRGHFCSAIIISIVLLTNHI